MGDAASKQGKGLVIGVWISRVIVLAIFAMGAIMKLSGQAGELAEKLPGGSASAYAIGAAELAAIVLILVPKTRLIGSALASMIMLGAVGSHLFGPVGMEGDVGAMLPLAGVALLAAIASLVLTLRLSKRG